MLGPASRVATVVLFGLISFWALREFITLTPTRLGDHRALFWVFFLFTPLQYVLVGMGVRVLRPVQHVDPGVRVSCSFRRGSRWPATTSGSWSARPRFRPA